MKLLQKRGAGVAAALVVTFMTMPARMYAAEHISSTAQAKIDEFMALRMTVAALGDNGAALTAIDSFAKSSAASSTLTDEEQLILENFVLLERYNYLKADSANKSLLRTSLKAQKDKCDAWMNAHKAETPNKWLCVTYADTISCYISFAMSGVIKYGLSIKDYYSKAISQDAHCSYVLTNLAQWYYWAPKLNGGSKKKAGEYFEQALQSARNDAEVYFASSFLSQYVFETGDKARAATLLAAAKAKCPASTYIARLERINAQGMSLFEYDRKHSKMEGKPQE